MNSFNQGDDIIPKECFVLPRGGVFHPVALKRASSKFSRGSWGWWAQGAAALVSAGSLKLLAGSLFILPIIVLPLRITVFTPSGATHTCLNFSICLELLAITKCPPKGCVALPEAEREGSGKLNILGVGKVGGGTAMPLPELSPSSSQTGRGLCGQALEGGGEVLGGGFKSLSHGGQNSEELGDQSSCRRQSERKRAREHLNGKYPSQLNRRFLNVYIQ